MSHQLYDIWLNADKNSELPWAAQLVDNVGHFATETLAEKYVEAVRKYREKLKAKLR